MSVSSMSTRARALVALFALAPCAAVALALTARAQSVSEPVRAQSVSLAAWGRPAFIPTTTTSTIPPTTTTVRQSPPTSARRQSAQAAPARSANSVEACIVQRESHGNYYPHDNPTHFGKYQYDRQTWVAHGGSAAEWGSASPAEQERVFRNGVSKYGYSAWTPYDGC